MSNQEGILSGSYQFLARLRTAKYAGNRTIAPPLLFFTLLEVTPQIRRLRSGDRSDYNLDAPYQEAAVPQESGQVSMFYKPDLRLR